MSGQWRLLRDKTSNFNSFPLFLFQTMLHPSTTVWSYYVFWFHFGEKCTLHVFSQMFKYGHTRNKNYNVCLNYIRNDPQRFAVSLKLPIGGKNTNFNFKITHCISFMIPLQWWKWKLLTQQTWPTVHLITGLLLIDFLRHEPGDLRTALIRHLSHS